MREPAGVVGRNEAFREVGEGQLEVGTEAHLHRLGLAPRGEGAVGAAALHTVEARAELRLGHLVAVRVRVGVSGQWPGLGSVVSGSGRGLVRRGHLVVVVLVVGRAQEVHGHLVRLRVRLRVRVRVRVLGC